jgi:hypothetical protein
MKSSKSNFIFAIIIVIALLVLSPAANARSTLLVEPGSVKINCELSLESMNEGIVSGGAVRGWVVIHQEPGATHLRYVKGENKHTITVNIWYASDWYDVTYEDSTNLNFKVKKNGKRYIHPRPIGWMENLSNDIRKSTDELCSGKSVRK